MKEKTGGGIRKTERNIHNRASLDNTRPGQKNVSRSKHIRLRNRRSIVNKV